MKKSKISSEKLVGIFIIKYSFAMILIGFCFAFCGIITPEDFKFVLKVLIPCVLIAWAISSGYRNPDWENTENKIN